MWWPSKASLGSCCEQKESQVQVSQHVVRRQVQVSQQEDVVRSGGKSGRKATPAVPCMETTPCILSLPKSMVHGMDSMQKDSQPKIRSGSWIGFLG